MGIKIDEEFKNQIPPLTAEELGGLEEGIIEAGRAINPIVTWAQMPECCDCGAENGDMVWEDSDEVARWMVSATGDPDERGNDEGAWRCKLCRNYIFDYDELILDGHNRYEICTRLNLPFDTVQMTFSDREAAEDWIDRNQLHRRNLNPNGASLLRGRIYNRTKKTMAEAGAMKGKASDKLSEAQTAKELATDYGVTSRTIERDGQFARAVETVKAADPTIEQRVHNGEVSKQSVVAAAEVIREPRMAEIPKVAERAAEVITPAVRVALPVAKPEPTDPTKSDSITIEAWEKLTPEQRETVLTASTIAHTAMPGTLLSDSLAQLHSQMDLSQRFDLDDWPHHNTKSFQKKKPRSGWDTKTCSLAQWPTYLANGFHLNG